MTHDDMPSYDDLIAFAGGDLDGETARRLQQYIDQNSEAAATVARYQSALSRMQFAHYPDAPPSLIARAKQVFRNTTTDSKASGATWFDQLGTVLAHLVFDSRLQPLAVRDRGGSDVVHLTYEAPGLDVDLRAERKSDSTPDGIWEVMGQVSDEREDPGVEIVAVDARTHQIVAKVSLDETSMFSIELPDGIYDLGVRGRSDVIILPELLLE